MATPVAHACIGLACLALVRAASPESLARPSLGQALACAFAACMPDLDIAASLILFDNPTALHSGPTHSLGFVAILSSVIWLGLRNQPNRSTLALALTLALASHVAVDFLTGPVVGLNPSFGVPGLWPLTDQRVNAAITVFRGVKHGSIAGWFSDHNLFTVVFELLLGLPLAFWSLLTLRHPRVHNPLN